MSDRSNRNLLIFGLCLFSWCTFRLYEAIESVGALSGSAASNPAHLFARALWLPVAVTLLAFTMDSLALALGRSRWTFWGAFGFASACFISQSIVIIAGGYFPPLLVALLATPWLVRRALSGQLIPARILTSKAE